MLNTKWLIILCCCLSHNSKATPITLGKSLLSPVKMVFKNTRTGTFKAAPQEKTLPGCTQSVNISHQYDNNIHVIRDQVRYAVGTSNRSSVCCCYGYQANTKCYKQCIISMNMSSSGTHRLLHQDK
jgi:hypothetical protein